MAIFDLGDLTNQFVQTSDFVSSFNGNDYTDTYKFTTTQASDIEIDLTNNSTVGSVIGIFGGVGVFDTFRINIDLTLFSDSNGNGFLDIGDEQLAASLSTDDGPDGQDEFISYTGAPGTFFAFVEPREFYSLGGGYDLAISTSLLPGGTPVEPGTDPIDVPPIVSDNTNFFFGTTEGSTIFASDLDDTIIGGSQGDTGDGDTLFARAGDDFILGGAGSDVMFGGAGDDLIFGGSGDDFIVGGAGSDLLYGGTTAGEGTGRDIFAFGLGKGTDIVLDFEVGIDAIGLTGGLSFGQLYVVQSAQDTVIGAVSTGEALAVLTNVTASDLSEQAFISVS